VTVPLSFPFRPPPLSLSLKRSSILYSTLFSNIPNLIRSPVAHGGSFDVRHSACSIATAAKICLPACFCDRHLVPSQSKYPFTKLHVTYHQKPLNVNLKIWVSPTYYPRKTQALKRLGDFRSHVVTRPQRSSRALPTL
jgi:hypothetical protein